MLAAPRRRGWPYVVCLVLVTVWATTTTLASIALLSFDNVVCNGTILALAIGGWVSWARAGKRRYALITDSRVIWRDHRSTHEFRLEHIDCAEYRPRSREVALLNQHGQPQVHIPDLAYGRAEFGQRIAFLINQRLSDLDVDTPGRVD